MVQAQHEQSQFTLRKYAVFKFMKIRTAKNRHNVAFSRADCKFKVPIGELDFSITSILCGKRVTVGSNETFMVGDHDFTKLLLITDAYLLHELPEPDDSEGSPKVGEWYTGQVYYRLKGMATEGSSAMCCTAELSEIMI